MFIIPLFTGSYIVGEEESTSRDLEVAYLKQNALLIKPNKSAEYRFIMKRSRNFKHFEVDLLKIIIREFSNIEELELEDSNYELILQNKAIEKAICESLSPLTAETMLGLITEMQTWANRTYEGRRTTFGLIINQSDPKENEQSLHYSRILNRDFVALLSDGKNSYLEFDREGCLMGYISLGRVRTCLTTTPNEFEYIARYCNEKRIGISLNEHGDLLVFRNRSLLFAKRRGHWNVYSHEEVIQLLSLKNSHTMKEVRRSIYLSALDCSFNYTGGILICLNKDMAEKALPYINAKDMLDQKYYEIKKQIELDESTKLYNIAHQFETKKNYDLSYEKFLLLNHCVKTTMLRQIIQGRKFQDIGRKLREEMVAMDGACIIDYDGTIIAVGAILKIDAGSNAGGRLAAASNLAKYGVSIKISQDGQMQGFCKERKIFKSKPLFTVN